MYCVARSGWYGARLHGQVPVQRSVRLDCLQDQPRPAEHQGPGGDHQGQVRPNVSAIKKKTYCYD